MDLWSSIMLGGSYAELSDEQWKELQHSYSFLKPSLYCSTKDAAANLVIGQRRCERHSYKGLQERKSAELPAGGHTHDYRRFYSM